MTQRQLRVLPFALCLALLPSEVLDGAQAAAVFLQHLARRHMGVLQHPTKHPRLARRLVGVALRLLPRGKLCLPVSELMCGKIGAQRSFRLSQRAKRFLRLAAF